MEYIGKIVKIVEIISKLPKCAENVTNFAYAFYRSISSQGGITRKQRTTSWIFWDKLIWSYWTNCQNSPNFRPLHIRLKNTFQNGRHTVWAKFGFANISVLETHRNLILVGIPMFSWSKNPLRQVNITLGILVYAPRHSDINWVFPYFGISVSFPMFSGSMNPIKAIMITLGH